MLIAAEIQRSLTGERQAWSSAERDLMPADDHHFVAFGISDPPAVLRLLKETTTGCNGRGEPRLREVGRHSELEVDAVALPAPLRLRSVELLERQHRVQPPREAVVRAGQWLARTLLELDERAIRQAYGPYTHAARALALWRSKDPYAIWESHRRPIPAPDPPLALAD